MRQITVAATQFACTCDLPANADRAEALVRQAAGQGAQIILLQELFATPYLASNRIGTETAPEGTAVTFYGSSFIADPTGQLVAKASRDTQEILLTSFDLDAIAILRRSWGVFRDRRPEIYRAVATLDGPI